jgi:hypothetical protein
MVLLVACSGLIGIGEPGTTVAPALALLAIGAAVALVRCRRGAQRQAGARVLLSGTRCGGRRSAGGRSRKRSASDGYVWGASRHPK